MGTDLIDRDRLAETFKTLVVIDSISREEGKLCRWLSQRLKALGFSITVDSAGAQVDGDTGNLIARWPGNRQAEPLLLSAHMDTVEPGRGVRVQFAEGVFSSAGNTILGADDKSAIAIILEVIAAIQEQNLPCGPLELVMSICEEVGLLGAKHLDYGRINARMGYVLDTRNPEAIITRAPSANRFEFRIHGKAAHAGAAPEKGINAIAVAGRAIARLKLGRIDHETTCNLGVIEGGLATNIVPDLVVVKGEARSHDEAKLVKVTADIVSAFEQAVAVSGGGPDGESVPRLETVVHDDFRSLQIDSGHPVVNLARQAALNLGMRMDPAVSGGGSDASVFAEHGIVTAVLGTGMENVHTTGERISLEDMVRSAALLVEIINLHAEREEGTLL